MAWEGVVTNAGKNAIERYLAGEAEINFNLVKLGSGSVSVENMKTQTDIQTLVTTGSIQKVTYTEEGVRFRLAAGSYGENGYTWTELGLFADVTINNVTTSVLMALYQETGDGVIIPNAEAFPDFVYVLSVIITVSNTGDLDVTIDTDSYVARVVFEEELDGIRAEIAEMVNVIYPVGAIYMSVNNVNPATLFQGTTWEQIEDKFLLCAGTNHAAGETGGKEEYVAADMPKHSHTRGSMNITGKVAIGVASGWVDVDNRYQEGALYGSGNNRIGGASGGGYDGAPYITLDASKSWTGSTSESGDNVTATIMPPYLSVYAWKRTA